MKTFSNLSVNEKQALISEYKNGKTIQYYYCGIWKDVAKSPMIWYPSIKYRIKPMSEEAIMKQNTEKSWSFQSTSIEDIDWKLIFKDLSKKNPIALIDLENDTGFIAIYDYLINKASLIKRPYPETLDSYLYLNGLVYEVEKQNFSKWIQWAKEVKAARWPKNIRNKQKVTVSLPTI